MVSTQVSLSGLVLQNPVIPASGTFGYGYEFAELYDINCLGSFSCKGTTKDPRFGNETPRIADCPSGMLNSVGLQNPGIDAVLQTELPRLKRCYHGKIIANISGFSVDDYCYVAERFDSEECVGLIEVNISCPNVKCGGMAFGTEPGLAASVTEAVRKVTKKPIYIKLSPNVADITEIARACEAAGADGISMINTLLGMRIDLQRQRPVLHAARGGLSGPAVLPVALRMVYDVYNAVSIPIIGMGGVSSAHDVVEMMLAGATAVEIGAANLVDPMICSTIVSALPQIMEQYKIKNLNDIIGGAHKWEKTS